MPSSVRRLGYCTGFRLKTGGKRDLYGGRWCRPGYFRKQPELPPGVEILAQELCQRRQKTREIGAPDFSRDPQRLNDPSGIRIGNQVFESVEGLVGPPGCAVVGGEIGEERAQCLRPAIGEPGKCFGQRRPRPDSGDEILDRLRPQPADLRAPLACGEAHVSHRTQAEQNAQGGRDSKRGRERQRDHPGEEAEPHAHAAETKDAQIVHSRLVESVTKAIVELLRTRRSGIGLPEGRPNRHETGASDETGDCAHHRPLPVSSATSFADQLLLPTCGAGAPVATRSSPSWTHIGVASVTDPSTRPDNASTSFVSRRPERSSPRWTTMSMAEAAVGTTNRSVMFWPASNGSVQILVIASRAEFAWIVVMPGIPEFNAMRRSRASASRTSPMMMRSGRIRRASLTSLRRGTSPFPSKFALRHCMATMSQANRLSQHLARLHT